MEFYYLGAIFGARVMKLLTVSILVLILIIPIGASTLVHFTDDEQSCELLEKFGEEEEGDNENEVKDFEESQAVKNYFVTKIKHDLIEFQSIKEYASHNELHNAIVMEVQTPPPENTMC